MGAVAAVGVVVTCFLPWVQLDEITITGFFSGPTNFGKPGLMNTILSGLAILLFLLPKIWAKRTNMFVTTFNMAWSARNYLLITQCVMGECPNKRYGIYLLVFLSVVMLVMSLIPKQALKQDNL